MIVVQSNSYQILLAMIKYPLNLFDFLALAWAGKLLFAPGVSVIAEGNKMMEIAEDIQQQDKGASMTLSPFYIFMKRLPPIHN